MFGHWVKVSIFLDSPKSEPSNAQKKFNRMSFYIVILRGPPGPPLAPWICFAISTAIFRLNPLHFGIIQPIEATMDASAFDLQQLTTTSQHVVQRLLVIGENRLSLLMVEIQEERQRLMQVFLITLGIAVFGLLSGMCVSALMVVLFWSYSPVLALGGLTVLYGIFAFWLCLRVSKTMREWRTFPDSLEQLRKDRVCLIEALS